MSFRARLALGSAAAVAVAIVVSSIVVYFLVRNELRSEIDNSLRSQAVQIPNLPGRPLQVRVGPHEYAIYIQADPFGGQFQLVDSNGNSYRPQEFNRLNSLLPGVAQARLVAAGNADGGFRDARQNGTHLRIFTTQLS